MDKLLQLFRIATFRRNSRIAVFVLKHLMALLSASLEVFMRHHLGRRYMLTVLLAFFLCTFYSSAVARRAPLIGLFWLAFFIRLIYQFCYNSILRQQGQPEQHTLSTGESADIWRRLEIRQTTVQRYIEPALGLLAGLLVFTLDRFLGLWLALCAVALFIKEQFILFRTTRRIMDTADARLEAQQFNTSLNQYVSRPGHGAQRSHRARLAARLPSRSPGERH